MKLKVAIKRYNDIERLANLNDEKLYTVDHDTVTMKTDTFWELVTCARAYQTILENKEIEDVEGENECR